MLYRIRLVRNLDFLLLLNLKILQEISWIEDRILMFYKEFKIVDDHSVKA